MDAILDFIEQANATELEVLLDAVTERYAELFPGWEVSIVSTQTSKNRNEQLNRMIDILQDLKSFEDHI